MNRTNTIRYSLGPICRPLIKLTVILSLLAVLGFSLLSSPPMAVASGFIENRGQVDQTVRYYVPGAQAAIYFTAEAVVLDLKDPAAEQTPAFERGPGPHDPDRELAGPVTRRGCAVWLSFEDTNPSPVIEARGREETRYNFLLGSDPARWRTDVPVFSELVYHDLWPGIDLVCRVDGGDFTYEFSCRPGVDPGRARFLYEGAERVTMDPGGFRRIETSLGTLFDDPPVAGKQKGRIALAGKASPSDQDPGAQSKSLPLVWSALLGGSGTDMAFLVSDDSAGYIIVAGMTTSADFPTTPGAYDQTYASGNDVFVVKLHPSGTAISWGTFIGGASSDEPLDIALDGSNNIVLSGYTGSSDFPTTTGAYDQSFNGSAPVYHDVFVFKLSSSGSSLLWSTFLGGNAREWGEGVVLDGTNYVIVTGSTESFDFPATPGSYDEILSSHSDIFISKFDATCSSLLYSTFIGCTGDWDHGYDIALDSSHNIVVVGWAGNSSFPTTPGTFDPTWNGSGVYDDAVLFKMNPLLNGLVYSTFLGGTAGDVAYRVLLDTSQQPIVFGHTSSSDFPTTSGAYDTSYNGGGDFFVCKATADASVLLWCTYVGGSSYEPLWNDKCGLALDGAGNPWVTGDTESDDFPTTVGAFDEDRNNSGGTEDAFFAKISSTGSSLLYGSFLGGSSYDHGFGVTLAADGDVILVGSAGGDDFPATPGSFGIPENSNGGYVTRIDPGGVATTPSTPTMDTEPEYTGGTGNTVSWSDESASGAGLYMLQRATDPDFTQNVYELDWMRETEYTFSGLTHEQIYYYRVKARDYSIHETGWSNVVHSTQDRYRPESNVDALPATQNSLTFDVPYTATDPVSGIASVELFFEVDGGGYGSYGVFTSSPIYFTAGGEGTYGFYTVATDGAGNVEIPPTSPPDATTTVILAPDTPTMVAEPIFTPGDSNLVAWSDESVSGAVAYWAQCSINATFTLVVQESGWIPGIEHTFGSLVDGQIYYYRVKAKSSSDSESGWSAGVFSTQDASPPSSLVTALPDTQAVLTFDVAFTADDAVSGFVAVELFFEVDGGGYISYGTFPVSPVSFTAAGEGLYGFYTVATDGVGNMEDPPVSPPDATTTIFKAPGVPTMVAEPLYTPADSNSVAWSDESGSGAEAYLAQCAEDPGFTAGLQESGWIAGTQYTFGSLVDGQLYHYRVKAKLDLVVKKGESEWSVPVSSTQDASPPNSMVEALPGTQTSLTFDVPYTASDPLSGVASVELFFNVDGGGYSSYGLVGASPVSFTAAGFGLYGFYTVATDSLGNVEPIPASPPDASTQVVSPGPTWTDVTSGPLGDTGLGRGVAWGDYDSDGDLDLYLTCCYADSNRLLRNDGGGAFVDVTAGPLYYAGCGMGAAWGDYDNDGNLDLLTGYLDRTNVLCRNDGAGGFIDVTSGPLAASSAAWSVVWVDYDNDGNLDVYVTDYVGSGRSLFRNEGGGVFTDASSGPLAETAGENIGVAWADYDNDGDQDLYVTKNSTSLANMLIRNDGGGVFTEVTSGPLGQSSARCFGAAWGDFDNDGDLDLYVTSQSGANLLLRNEGGDVFTDITNGPLGNAGQSTGVAWGDYDNDGDLDLYITNMTSSNKLLRNDGGDVFTDVTEGPLAMVATCIGVAWGDYDSDGDLDLYVVNTSGANRLIRNDLGKQNHWLHIDLHGDAANAAGIGTRLRCVTEGMSQIHEVSGGSGIMSQNSLTAEFGLGTAVVVDSLIVRWPSGTVDVLTWVDVDDIRDVIESDPLSHTRPEPVAPARYILYPCAPNPFNPRTRIRYDLPEMTSVRLSVFDISGRLVRVLREGILESPGQHEAMWDGQNDAGQTVAAGMYFYRLEAGPFRETQRMVLIK
ncbi:MAG: FG-GAP-like repeat-containing protein [bacterium]